MNERWLKRYLHRVGVVGSTYKSLRDAAINAQRARIPQMAAALSYRTIFGLLPVIVVALVGLKMFTTPEDIQSLARTVLTSTGITAIAIDEDDAAVEAAREQSRRSWMRAMGFEDLPVEHVAPDAVPPTAATPAPVVTDKATVEAESGVTPEAVQAAERASKRLDDWIQGLISRVNTISFPALGLVGIGALIYAAMGMLVEIERAFNQIFRATRGRSWSMRIVLYWTLLTLGPLALFATFYIGNRARAMTEGMVTGFSGFGGDLSAIGVVIIGYIFTVAISGAVLLLLYMAVPNTKVAFRSAAIGAVVAAVAWEASKWGFAQYIDYTRGKSYVRLYGSMALIPLFLLWVYVTWLVVLWGLQIAFHLQFGRKADPATMLLDTSTGITEPSSAIDLLAALANRFKSGKPANSRDLAMEVGIAEGAASSLLVRFAEAGFVHRVAASKREAVVTENGNGLRTPDKSTRHAPPPPSAYVLARPPETIALRDVLTAAFPATTAPSPAEGSEEKPRQKDDASLTTQLRNAQVQAVGEKTLANAQAEANGRPNKTRPVTL